jgi:hypothetical protein
MAAAAVAAAVLGPVIISGVIQMLSVQKIDDGATGEKGKVA